MLRPHGATITVALLLLSALSAVAGEPPTKADDLERVLEMERSFTSVIDKARLTVVAIRASYRPPTGDAPEPAPRREGPLLPPSLVPPAQDQRRRGGTGSGVIISPDGLILTNHHVAGWATDILVVRADGTRHDAQVIGTDPRGDLALLRIRGKDLPFAPLGPDDRPVVGSWVVAMGNPFTLAINDDGSPIVTHGIVSGLHRIQRGTSAGELFYGDAVQTDAEINPGNSGGPLFDLRGRLAGINGRIATRRGNYRINTGVGFAISARQIRRVLPSLRAGGTVRHGFLGIRYDVDERHGAGIEVCFVYPGSPAEAAGIRPGDRITSVDDRAIRAGSRLAGILSTFPEGARARVRFARKGRPQAIEVVLARRPAGATR